MQRSKKTPPAHLQDAERAVVDGLADFVLAPVEERADLVDPALADGALDPRLLVHLVVLLACKIALVERAVGHLDRLFVFELSVAYVAPVILVLATREVVRVAADPLSVTRWAVAVVHSGLVDELFVQTEGAGLAVLLA